MPQEFKTYTNPEQDSRRNQNIIDEKEQIIAKYNAGTPLRELGREYNCDRHTIKAIIFPDWYKNKQEKRYAQKPWLKYYKKDEWKLVMRKYRSKKRKLGLAIKKQDNATI